MADNRPGVMLYFETLQAIAELDAEDAKQMIAAILRYSVGGEVPAFRGTMAALWLLIRPSLDRDEERYNTKRLRGLYLTYCRKCKADDTPSLDFDEWVVQHTDNDTLPHVERTDNDTSTARLPTTTSSASSATSSTATKIEGVGADKPPAPVQPRTKKPARKKYGEFGRVLLTDDEFSKLTTELGETELNRCIKYIDESAQTTDNRCQWADWCLVIRRCHREGWGLGRKGKDVQDGTISGTGEHHGGTAKTWGVHVTEL